MRCSFHRGLACLLLLFVILPAPAAAQMRRVVLLYDERTELPGLAILDARLVRTLRAGVPGSRGVSRGDGPFPVPVGRLPAPPQGLPSREIRGQADRRRHRRAGAGARLYARLRRRGVSRCVDRLLRDRQARSRRPTTPRQRHRRAPQARVRADARAGAQAASRDPARAARRGKLGLRPAGSSIKQKRSSGRPRARPRSTT